MWVEQIFGEMEKISIPPNPIPALKNMPLLKIEGVNSIDEAAKLRDKIIYIHRDDIPMEEGEYLIQDLMGLQVVDADDGHLYGELTQSARPAPTTSTTSALQTARSGSFPPSRRWSSRSIWTAV